MASAPLVVLLFERAFLAGSIREALRRSRSLYLGLACGWLLLVWLQWDAPHSDSAGFGHGIPAWVWWLTQCEMLWTYLRLVVWPAPLVIHYATPAISSVGDALPWLIPTVVLAAVSAALLWKNTASGFLAAAAWLILSPTLLVPIVTEVAAERRMYLPLAALVVLAVVGGYQWSLDARRYLSGKAEKPARPARAFAPAGVLILLLCVVSHARAELYQEPIALWQHTAEHQPNSAVVRNSLGGLLAVAGRPDAALPELEAAVQLKPDYAEAQCNLGLTLIKLGRPQEAVVHLQEALRLKPSYADAENNLATAYLNSGQPQWAIEHFQAAIRLQPDFSEAMDNLGDALLRTGQTEKALDQFTEALRVKPDNFEAHSNMAGALISIGRPAEALVHCQRAVELQPNYAHAQSNWSVALLSLGRADEAFEHAREEVRLTPNSFEAQYNAGNALAALNRPQESAEYLAAAVRLRPDDQEAQRQLGAELLAANRPQDALPNLEQAVRLRADDADAWYALALSQARIARPTDALPSAEKASALARAQGNLVLYRQVDQLLTSLRSAPAKDGNSPVAPSPTP